MSRASIEELPQGVPEAVRDETASERCNRLMLRRLPLVFTPQPDGGFTVTSPVLPELITEGDSVEEAYANVRDALAAVIELYEEQGRPLPAA